MIIRNIGTGLESATHRVAKRTLGHRRLPIRELHNKIVLGHTALAMRRFEDGEVRRLAPAPRTPAFLSAVGVGADNQ